MSDEVGAQRQRASYRRPSSSGGMLSPRAITVAVRCPTTAVTSPSRTYKLGSS